MGIEELTQRYVALITTYRLKEYFNVRVYCSVCYRPSGHGSQVCHECGGKTTDKDPPLSSYFSYAPSRVSRVNYISRKHRGTGSYKQHYDALMLAVVESKKENQ